MGWPEVSIEDFPPKRDDEPSSLRRDIIDELTDHFACAFNRELLKNSDEQLARQRVIIQFGDPVKIARQLWLDEMKEKIMSQRIMTGISAAMAVCCILVVGFSWLMMRENQLVNHQMLEQLAVISDRPQADSTVVKSLQRTNEAIVRELRILAESQRPSRHSDDMDGGFGSSMGEEDGAFGAMATPAEPSNINQQILKQLEQLNLKSSQQGDFTSEAMNQISFQLVQDNKGKKPAVEFTGRLTKIGTDAFSLNATSDAKGTLDFGKLPWGQYDLSLNAPWDETTHISRFAVIPGRNYSQAIVCPAVAPEEVSIRFQVNWPDTLKSEDWILLCDFRTPIQGKKLDPFALKSSRAIQNRTWSYEQRLQDTPKGVYLIGNENKVVPCPLSPQGKYENLMSDVLTDQLEIQMKQGKYRLPVVYLIRKADLKKLAELNSPKPFGILSLASNKPRPDLRLYTKFHGATGSGFFVAPFQKLKMEPRIFKILQQRYGIMSTMIHGIQVPELLMFTAGKEQPNVWEINIPDLDPITQESGSLSSVR